MTSPRRFSLVLPLLSFACPSPDEGGGSTSDDPSAEAPGSDAALGNAPDPQAGAPNIGGGLRMATFNAQFLPSKFNAGTLEENGERLVERILAADYDFIALNEVFDEDLREILTSGLKGRYPHYVEYLDGDDLEDSGLALYSKFAFDPLPDPQFRTTPPDCRASGPTVQADPASGVPYEYDADCDNVAFLEYDDCHDHDCKAGKGVALVRLHHPLTDQSINVMFTHMQASYIPANHPDEEADLDDAKDWYFDRKAQLETAEKLLRGTVGDGRIADELVFFLGDFNIDGDLADDDLGNYTIYNTENLHEWLARFSDPASFFADVLHDAWAFENAPAAASGKFDRGITNVTAWGGKSDGARLDYILTKPEAGCAQHMTLARNLDWGAPYVETGMGPDGIGLGGVDELSDHVGVNLDWNVRTTACSPATAHVVDVDPGELGQEAGHLDQPGTMKWYRFDEAGTYSFDLQGPDGAEFRVYEGTDLTTPVVNYKKETTEVQFKDLFVGEQFRISSAPFYVRVYHPDRTQGDVEYSLLALRHDCLSMQTACALRPGEALPHALPADPLGGLGNEAWFELYTESTPNDLTQELRFFVQAIPDTASDGGFELELVDADGVSPIDSNKILEPAVGGLGLSIRSTETKNVKRYLKVVRMPPGTAPYPAQYNHFAIGWTTDLTILFGAAQGGQSLQLRCLAENDGVDLDYDDEMWLASASIGGTEVADKTFIGDFDDGNKAPMDGILNAPLHFTSADPLVVEFFEYDDGLNGGDDVYQHTIDALDPAIAGPLPQSFTFAPGGDGLYQFRYNLTHGFDE
jgi:hypothetical protein